MPIYLLIFVLHIAITEGLYNYSFINLSESRQTDKLTVFKPDSTINKRLFLEDYESSLAFFPNINKYKTHEFIRSHPIMIFSNEQKNEYLIAFQYEGGSKNEFDCFEIGYFEDDKRVNKKLALSSKETIFKTESGLGLGTTLEEITRIKGKNFQMKTKGKDMILSYHLNDKHPFVKRYYMADYFMELRLRENKVRQITFGFEYP